MRLIVVLNKDSMDDSHIESPYVEIVGPNIETYEMNRALAQKMEDDGFLDFAWDELGSNVDWGDVDFIYPKECKKLGEWSRVKLETATDSDLIAIYKVIADYADKATKYNTGIEFDF